MKRDNNRIADEMYHKLPEQLTVRTHPHQNTVGRIGTLGWKLKRRGVYDLDLGTQNNMYGKYLGVHEGRHVVGVLNLGSKKDFNATELFETPDELMSHWVVE